jgi:predicted metal-dependent enzyme (double-stranded beta helix superfamily)
MAAPCPESQSRLALIEALDAAVESSASPDNSSGDGPESICNAVKEALQEAVAAKVKGEALLDPAYLECSESGYARHLFHRDPAGRYSVVIMVWDDGQGTPIHDHAGTWCVECVYDGVIDVESFEPVDGDPKQASELGFAPLDELHASVGMAGALIPPSEYHLIRNGGEGKAVTIHVYGGELSSCNCYEEIAPGRYRRASHPLSYDSTPCLG